tara:strand:+ start:2225 stop:2341 length:117 start_codon:yes stop_codon:yes gene_type:complete
MNQQNEEQAKFPSFFPIYLGLPQQDKITNIKAKMAGAA